MNDYPDGYPRFAALMTSDTNTRVYRRFGWERNRLLLYKQDRVAELSNQLRALDTADDQLEALGLYSRRDDEAIQPCQRIHILRRLDEEMKEYDDLISREHAVASIPKPTKANHRAIFGWVYNNKPIVAAEYQYLYQTDDFVLLGNQDDRWLRSFEDKIWALSCLPLLKVSLDLTHCSCRSLFGEKAGRQQNDPLVRLTQPSVSSHPANFPQQKTHTLTLHPTTASP